MYSAADNNGAAKGVKGSTEDSASPRTLTELGAALNLGKFCIGLGIISLPEATKHVGWLPSILGLGVVAFIVASGIFFAVRSRNKLDQLEEDEKNQNAARSMSEGAPLLNTSWRDMPDSGCAPFDQIVGKVLGPWVQYLFAMSIALGQFATLVIYLNVITYNFESYFPAGYHLLVLLALVFVLGLFVLVPTLQGASVLSAMGLAIYTFVFAGVVYELSNKVRSNTMPPAVMIRNPADRDFGAWFGAACFSFSAFPIAMVIYEDLRETQAFHKVISCTLVMVWIIYSVFAVCAFLTFGEQTDPLIYLNFAEASFFRDGASAALALSLSLSFLVQAVPLFQCTTKVFEWAGLNKKIGVASLPLPVTRWPVVVLVAAVAYLVPDFKVMMNTLGAITGVLSGFIIPAVTYLKLSSSDEWMARGTCLMVVTVGVMGAYYSCAAAGH